MNFMNQAQNSFIKKKWKKLNKKLNNNAAANFIKNKKNNEKNQKYHVYIKINEKEI